MRPAREEEEETMIATNGAYLPDDLAGARIGQISSGLGVYVQLPVGDHGRGGHVTLQGTPEQLRRVAALCVEAAALADGARTETVTKSAPSVTP